MRPTFCRSATAVLLAVLVGWPPTAATQEQPGPAAFKVEELDQLVAPIALYPDPLVAQALMASTYPLDIVQAARFAKENAKLTGDQLSEALKPHPWDDSVKSLVSFPQVLAMMSEKLDWTQKLGDAFLAQQQDVMAAVQRLRAKAHTAGNLKTTAEQKVTVAPAEAPSRAASGRHPGSSNRGRPAGAPDRGRAAAGHDGHHDRAHQPAGRLRADLQSGGRVRGVAVSGVSAAGALLPARLRRGHGAPVVRRRHGGGGFPVG